MPETNRTGGPRKPFSLRRLVGLAPRRRPDGPQGSGAVDATPNRTMQRRTDNRDDKSPEPRWRRDAGSANGVRGLAPQASSRGRAASAEAPARGAPVPPVRTTTLAGTTPRPQGSMVSSYAGTGGSHPPPPPDFGEGRPNPDVVNAHIADEVRERIARRRRGLLPRTSAR